MVNWALEYAPPAESRATILEVGSGNGTLLFALLDAGYPPESLCGIDYSLGSIKLASSIAATRGGDTISFHLCDFLTQDPPTLPSMSSGSTLDAWDLILDKGTFDAIALMEKDPETGKAPVDGYPSKIARLLKPGGHFLITCMMSQYLPFVLPVLKHPI
jgi:SAM-dependent methyltransferase